MFARTTVEALHDDYGYTIRSGIIPTIRTASGLYWLMGIDPEEKYSDFGGQHEEGETAYQTALRELDEESSGTLTALIKEHLDRPDSGCVVWRYRIFSLAGPPENSYITFVTLDEAPTGIFVPNDEIVAMTWVEENEILHYLPIEAVHEPLRPFIRFFDR